MKMCADLALLAVQAAYPSSSHDEGCVPRFRRGDASGSSTMAGGNVKALQAVPRRMEGWPNERSRRFGVRSACDNAFLAMGFTQSGRHPSRRLRCREGDERGNAKATTDGEVATRPVSAKVFAAGDVRRSQSLVVWAIREGRQAAREVDAFLMGDSTLPGRGREHHAIMRRRPVVAFVISGVEKWLKRLYK